MDKESIITSHKNDANPSTDAARGEVRSLGPGCDTVRCDVIRCDASSSSAAVLWSFVMPCISKIGNAWADRDDKMDWV